MGVIKQGIQGGFSGKVGPHVGSSWKGINVMRAMPTSVANPNTEAQQAQRSAFKQTSMLASAILTSIIKPFWDREAVKMSGYNLFVKTNIVNATKELGFDFSKLQMSVGRMDAIRVDSFGHNEVDKFQIAWDRDSTPLYSSGDDEAVVVILANDGSVIASKQLGVKRSVGAYQLSINGAIPEGLCHLYLFFVSPDKKTISKTAYRPSTI